MMRRTEITEDVRTQFLDLLARGYSVVRAAESLNTARQSWYDIRDADEAFRKAWDDAVEAGTDRLEDEAWRRGVDGVEEPVYQGGRLVGHVLKYSDGLLTLMLKSRRRKVYGDKQEIKHDGELPPRRIILVADSAAPDGADSGADA